MLAIVIVMCAAAHSASAASYQGKQRVAFDTVDSDLASMSTRSSAPSTIGFA
jgi:hypothetical protein